MRSAGGEGTGRGGGSIGVRGGSCFSTFCGRFTMFTGIITGWSLLTIRAVQKMAKKKRTCRRTDAMENRMK